MPFRAADFKSAAYADSAKGPLVRSCACGGDTSRDPKGRAYRARISPPLRALERNAGPSENRKRTMTESLHGARVALLESRRESELASLVRRHGGEPVCVPALREVARDFRDELERAIDAIERGGTVVVLTTGTGLERVLRLADATGRGATLRASLARST